MKTTKLFFGVLLCFLTISTSAQTADEIINNYLENTGGIENWRALKGLKMKANIVQGGFEIPFEGVQLAEGKTSTKAVFQGKEVFQNVFDGKTLWNSNIMTMKPEKSDSESTANYKLEMNDFPNHFLDYKKKGYKVELLGKEEYDGAETFKIKLTKEPVTIDGKQEESVDFYYFDTENYVPIAMETKVKAGPMKGMTTVSTFSDYQEIGNLYMAYSIGQAIKEQPAAVTSISIQSYELNPEVDVKIFDFPEVKETAGEKKN